ncbi:MAG: chemotaxis protein CheB [Ferruginibacter sp.]
MAQNKLTIPGACIIGGSAGSLDILLEIIDAIPPDCKYIFIIIIHRKKDGESVLRSLLQARTKLPVIEVEDKDPILPGRIYLATPDYHLLLEKESYFSLDYSEKVHFSRPSIDVSFESAALCCGEATVGILLSGANEDGASGLKLIQQCGGKTIVQDPDFSDASYMPQKALDIIKPDAILRPGNVKEVLLPFLQY